MVINFENTTESFEDQMIAAKLIDLVAFIGNLFGEPTGDYDGIYYWELESIDEDEEEESGAIELDLSHDEITVYIYPTTVDDVEALNVYALIGYLTLNRIDFEYGSEEDDLDELIDEMDILE